MCVVWLMSARQNDKRLRPEQVRMWNWVRLRSRWSPITCSVLLCGLVARWLHQRYLVFTCLGWWDFFSVAYIEMWPSLWCVGERICVLCLCLCVVISPGRSLCCVVFRVCVCVCNSPSSTVCATPRPNTRSKAHALHDTMQSSMQFERVEQTDHHGPLCFWSCSLFPAVCGLFFSSAYSTAVYKSKPYFSVK